MPDDTVEATTATDAPSSDAPAAPSQDAVIRGLQMALDAAHARLSAIEAALQRNWGDVWHGNR